MIDRLLDFFLALIDDLLPWIVIPHYDRGYMFRLGNKKKVLEPGFHFKIPFVDNVLTHMVKTTTIDISEQSITTLDGKSIVVAAVVKYDVDDVEKLLCEVAGPVEAVKDMTKGIIRNLIIVTLWENCNDEKLANEITKKARVEARKWGIKIESVTLTDMGIIRSIRLFNTTEKIDK